MKICPNCNKTYEDDSLNFCLDDGTVLTQASSQPDNTPETVFIEPPQQTHNNQAFGTNQIYDNPQNYNANSAGGSGSGSKTWLWVLGIIAGLIFLCGGGGLIGLIAIGSMSEDEKPPKEIVDNKKDTKSDKKDLKINESSDVIRTSDFSDMLFGDNAYISVENENGQLVLTSKKNYYYVFGLKDFQTQGNTTVLTVKNVTGKSSNLGYGLVVQSHPTEILKNDYALLIRSDRQQYRIVRHKNKKESVVRGWTRSREINKGTEKNNLEARISGKKISFYINGKFVRTISDTNGFEDGNAGVYTSGNIPIAFTKIETRKY